MAAARHIPMTEAVWTINIDTTFTPTPKGVIVKPGDQVSFVNGSGVAISVQFAANPPGPAVSANLSIGVGATASFTAPNTNASANYNIYVGPTQKSGGPYAIQVGSGPLYVQVSYNVATGQAICTPDPVTIPYGNATVGRGTLEMMPVNAGDSFSVSWSNGDPFNPPLVSVDSLPHTEMVNVGSYPYAVAKTGIMAGGGSGGGTVKVKSS